MKPWSTFYPDVLPEVPGYVAPLVDIAMRRAAQEFFATTGVWRVWLDDVTTAGSDTTEYDIELEPNSELVKLLRATLDGRSIIVTTPDSLPSDWKTTTAGLADCVFTEDQRNLILLPAQEAGLVLKVEATLRPSDSAIGIEDAYFAKYSREIANGALAYLLAQLNKPYSNPLQAQRYQVLFDGAMAVTDLRRMRGFSGAMPRARVQFF
jgi:hypothetical protein